MKSTDLIIGEYYKIMKGDTFLITKNEGPNTDSHKNIDMERITGSCISNMDSKWEYRKDTTPYIGSGRVVHLATWDERKWLEVCMDRNEFIPKDKIKLEPNYEIY